MDSSAKTFANAQSVRIIGREENGFVPVEMVNPSGGVTNAWVHSSLLSSDSGAQASVIAAQKPAWTNGDSPHYVVDPSSEVEGQAFNECIDGRCEGVTVDPIDGQRIVANTTGEQGGSSCYDLGLLDAAKRFNASYYGVGPNELRSSGGACAWGVRRALNYFGNWTNNYGAHAIEWHDRRQGRTTTSEYNDGFLVRSVGGYKNVISQYPTPESAPAGAILVFEGPNSDSYLSHSTDRGTGRWVGHISIASDEYETHGGVRSRIYYSDGRQNIPAINFWSGNGRAPDNYRRLVGVYVADETQLGEFPADSRAEAEAACAARGR